MNAHHEGRVIFFFKVDIPLSRRDTCELGNDRKERGMSAKSSDSHSVNRETAVHLNHSQALFHCFVVPYCYLHSSPGHVLSLHQHANRG